MASLGPVAPSHADGLAVVDTVPAAGVPAALVFDDIAADGLMTGLSAQGVVIPREIRLIRYDEVPGAVTTAPPCSILTLTAAAGALAVNLLAAR